MYFVIVNGKQHRQYSSNEYQEALEEAAQLDHIYNSPELNDGIQGHNNIQLLTFDEMMKLDSTLVL